MKHTFEEIIYIGKVECSFEIPFWSILVDSFESVLFSLLYIKYFQNDLQYPFLKNLFKLFSRKKKILLVSIGENSDFPIFAKIFKIASELGGPFHARFIGPEGSTAGPSGADTSTAGPSGTEEMPKMNSNLEFIPFGKNLIDRLVNANKILGLEKLKNPNSK